MPMPYINSLKRKAADKSNISLRIAILGHKRIPSYEGGIEAVVGELATRLVKNGHYVTVYNRKNHRHINSLVHNSEISADEYKGVKLKSVFTIDFKGLAAMSSSFFGAIRCAFGRYDVVHFHAEGPCAMLWLPHLVGKRTVATIHGLDHKRAKWGRFASAYIMLGEKTAVKYADEIIVLSENLKNYFQDTYGRKTCFIPNGVGWQEYRKPKLISENYSLHKDDYFLFLGRIVPEKGLRYLISAFQNVHTEKKLVIAGGASDTEDFYNEVRNIAKTDNRILFTGFVQGEMWKELLSNAYVYVLPSDLEGMPLSLLEAMSFGNCCVTSDIPECAEVVEDKAILFQAGNVCDLTHKLQKLSDHPEIAAKYKENAAEYICRKYNWDKTVLQTIDIYENSLNSTQHKDKGAVL